LGVWFKFHQCGDGIGQGNNKSLGKTMLDGVAYDFVRFV